MDPVLPDLRDEEAEDAHEPALQRIRADHRADISTPKRASQKNS
jgi:hypothetical protein